MSCRKAGRLTLTGRLGLTYRLTGRQAWANIQAYTNRQAWANIQADRLTG